jgi:hypothetical protein
MLSGVDDINAGLCKQKVNTCSVASDIWNIGQIPDKVDKYCSDIGLRKEHNRDMCGSFRYIHVDYGVQSIYIAVSKTKL